MPARLRPAVVCRDVAAGGGVAVAVAVAVLPRKARAVLPLAVRGEYCCDEPMGEGAAAEMGDSDGERGPPLNGEAGAGEPDLRARRLDRDSAASSSCCSCSCCCEEPGGAAAAPAVNAAAEVRRRTLRELDSGEAVLLSASLLTALEQRRPPRPPLTSAAAAAAGDAPPLSAGSSFSSPTNNGGGGDGGGEAVRRWKSGAGRKIVPGNGCRLLWVRILFSRICAPRSGEVNGCARRRAPSIAGRQQRVTKKGGDLIDNLASEIGVIEGV